MTDDERAAQTCAFSVAHGHAGYLREAYHGGPYATPSSCQRRSRIRPATAASLRERLAATLKVARERQALVYNEPPDSEDTKCVLKSFTDFVELCERKERETGEPVRIAARY